MTRPLSQLNVPITDSVKGHHNKEETHKTKHMPRDVDWEASQRRDVGPPSNRKG